MNFLEHFTKFGLTTVRQNVDLYNHLTLRTRSKAQFYFEAHSRADMIRAKKASLKLNIPLFILGGGTNLAVIRPVISGLVVKNTYTLFEELDSNDLRFGLIRVSSGYPVTRLVNKTVELGLEGFEYQLGLPGSVGGALYMNSKWTKPASYFGDNLLYAEIINPEGEEKKVLKSYFKFAYDFSILQETQEIVLEAVFKLKKEATETLIKKSREALAYRKATQPTGKGTSGCFFRNVGDADKVRLSLPTTSAGYLIDKAGLKGKRFGKFFVSPIHANFIINDGNGKPEDLQKLLFFIKETVLEKFNISLEEEVIII